MNLELENCIALVPASSKGLGYALASELLHEGARVCINGRRLDVLESSVRELSELHAGRVTGIRGDVSVPSEHQKMVSHCVDCFGGLDLLVTNAGGPPKGLIGDLSRSDWIGGFDLAVYSAVALISLSKQYLVQSAHGSVLAISSYSAKEPIEGLTISNTMRPAIVALTKSVSYELGKYGVRANSLLPGWFRTAHTMGAFEHIAKVSGTTVDSEKARIEADCALGRLGEPEEFAKVGTFILSPAASFMTGSVVYVDGGGLRSIL